MHPDINPQVAEAFERMPFNKAMTAKDITKLVPEYPLTTGLVNNALKVLWDNEYAKRGIAKRYGIITWTKVRGLDGADRRAPRPGLRQVPVRAAPAGGAGDPTVVYITMRADLPPMKTEITA